MLAIRAGNYADVAARAAGIHKATFYRWMERGRVSSEMPEPPRPGKKPRTKSKLAAWQDAVDAREAWEQEAEFRDFCDAVTRASAEAEVRLVTLVATAGADDWRAAVEVLKRRFPARWRDQVHVEAENTNHHTFNSQAVIERMTPEQLKVLREVKKLLAEAGITRGSAA